MSELISYNGSTYIIPDTGDEQWGNNVTDFLVAIPTGCLQKVGGSFTLLADVNFGASFGLVSTYFKSRSTNIASAGAFRLSNSDAVEWRNAANSGNNILGVNGSDQLVYNGVPLEFNALPSAEIFVGNASNVATAVPMSGDIGIDNAGVTAIQSGVIVNADVSASAAIAYSKLNLVGQIVNNDIGSSASIAYSKLALANSIVNADINASAAIAYSKLNLTGDIVNADISASAAIAVNKLAALTVSSPARSDGSGFLTTGQTNLTSEVTGNLPVGNLNSGTAASGTTFWRGDGTWDTPAGTTYSAGTGLTLTTNVFSLTNPVAVTLGGTGLASVAQGDLLYGSASNTLSALAKSTSASRYLSNTGTSNNPAWAQVNLANGVSGSLPVASLGAGSPNQVLIMSGSTPTWSNNLLLSGIGSVTAQTVVIQATSDPFIEFIPSGASFGYVIDATDTSLSGNRTYRLSNVGSDGNFVIDAGTQTIGGNKTLSGTTNLSGLTASLPLQLDGSKNIVSTAINLSGSQVTGNLPVTNLNSGTSASSGTFWRGDGTWASPGGSGTVNVGTANQVAYYATSTNAVSGAATVTTDGANTLSVGAGTTSTNAATATINSGSSGATRASIQFQRNSVASGNVYSDSNGVVVNAIAGSSVFTAVNGVALSTQDSAKLTLNTPIVFSPSTTGITGTTTNNNATAGIVGEYISSAVGPTNYPTTAQWGDLTSISLTAGDWDVSVLLDSMANSATVTQVLTGVSTTSGNASTGLTKGDTELAMPPPTATFDSSVSLPAVRFSLSGTTTVYLKYLGVYTVATPQAAGRISARRVR